jgi:hypothetical protein
MTMPAFRSQLDAHGPGGAWIFLAIPFDVAATFGGRGRVPVTGTINGFPFRTSLLPIGDGTHRMAVSKPMQQGATATAGDIVEVAIERDDAERVVDVPPDLERAIAASTAADATFATLAYSHRKAHVDWIAGAKQQTTRERRIASAVEMLAAGKKRS